MTKCTVPSKSNMQKNFLKFSFLLASWRSMKKIAGSGSISQRYGSADPDLDPHQNVLDPQHYFKQKQNVNFRFFKSLRTYRTVVKRSGAVGDLDLNVIDRNVILGRGHVFHATAYLTHFPTRSRRQNFRQSFPLDLFVMRGYSEHCYCANSEKYKSTKWAKSIHYF